MGQFILAIDQGTTSTRSVIFDAHMEIAATAQEEFPQYFPNSGWVEHDPEEIWRSVETTMDLAIGKANLGAEDIAAIGITNQRETVVIWDKTTGEPIFNAIVWQDRRTSEYCDELRAQGLEEKISAITGLLIDPYFSSTKIKWLLDNVEGARERARAGELAFGTIDSFLIWRLTGGVVHATDATNAARTMLYDIHKGEWSSELCEIFDIPKEMLPAVKDCADNFGEARILDRSVPILGVAGDQQAATIGQACFEPGMIKSTYGTGCFALLNTGSKAVKSKNRLLTTIAYQLDGEVTYALEGSIFIAGAVVHWLRDGIEIIEDASETQALAEAADESQNVVVVPAFTGLGAPYWNANARAAIFGLTRGSTRKELVKASLESVGLQSFDLVEAMNADMGSSIQTVLRVDGGMSASAYAMQFLSDILERQVDRPKILETTVLGAAWLAGQKAGIYPGRKEFTQNWALDRSFNPKMQDEARQQKIEDWHRAVKACLSY